jgi:hypothetical protein
MIATALMIALAVVASPPGLSNQWVHWQAWRPVETGTSVQPQLVRFPLPLAVYGATQPDLADLRVIDDAGKEVPFLVDSQQPWPIYVWNDAILSDVGFVPGRYTQAVADVGSAHVLHNTLKLELPESDTDFFAWVSVEASDDHITWRIVRARAPVFWFPSDGLRGQQQVTFPDTSSRWLRVKVLDGQQRVSIDGVQVSREVVITPPLQRLTAPVSESPDSPDHKSWWDADLGVNNVPVTRVTFTATQPAFHRAVTISCSDDRTSWAEVAESDIYRESDSSQLSVDVPQGRGRYWRVTVFNRNDAPIDGLRVSLQMTPLYVVFRQEPDHNYFLLYGNDRVASPEYDFATVTTRAQRDAAMVVSAGPEAKNTAYQSPAPWTERHGWVMWAALLLAVVVIGALAIRTMRSTGS